MNRTEPKAGHSPRGTAAVLVACVLSGSLACVTGGTYDAMLAERDALFRKNVQLERDNAELEQELASLTAEMSALEASGRELSNRLSQQQEQVSELRGSYDQLVNDLKAELDSGKVQIERLRGGIRLSVADEVLFESGSAEIDSEGREVLEKVAAQVKSSPDRVEVVGHTDDKPIRSRLMSRYPTNWELAAARAASVVRLLQHQGVDGTRLRAISHGEFDPVESNQTENGRARNRRIEIRLMPPAKLNVAQETSESEAPQAPAADTAD
jgi:chemotaxis protein MotB